MYNRLLAYAVHLFTILGVYVSFLAIEAAVEKNISLVFLYLAIALLIDGIDGSLARWADVKTFAPKINGEILDNIIDFLSYVFIPAFVIHSFEFVSNELSDFAAFIILVTSCFTFANNNLKTKDNYFSGFPALWNIVLLYFYILDTAQFTNFCIILILAILTFTPIKFAHPFRVQNLRSLNLFVLLIWTISSFFLFIMRSMEEGYEPLLFWCWVGTNIYFIVITITRTFKTDS